MWYCYWGYAKKYTHTEIVMDEMISLWDLGGGGMGEIRNKTRLAMSWLFIKTGWWMHMGS